MRGDILILKTPKGEMSLEYWLNDEYKRVNNILSLIEKEFDTDMNEHEELRNYILDTSNYIKRLNKYIESEG